jgi:prepilin-type N-terminal cleavage/methylation domain-containing protein
MRHKRKPSVYNSGFTLIELLIAMTIFSVGILGIMTLQIKSIQNNSLAGSSTAAGAIAQLHLENIISRDFHAPGITDINKENNGDLNSVNNVDFRNINADGKPVYWGKYDLVCNVADDTPIRNTKTFVVTVTWDKGRHSRRLSTIKSLASGSIVNSY